MYWTITDRLVREDNPTIVSQACWTDWTDMELRFLAYLYDPAEDNPYRNHRVLRFRRKHLIKDLDGWDFFQKPPQFVMNAAGDPPQKSENQWRRIIGGRDHKFDNGIAHYRQQGSGLLAQMAEAHAHSLTYFTKVLSGRLSDEEKKDFDQKLFDNRLKLIKEWPALMNAVSTIPKLAASLPEENTSKDTWNMPPPSPTAPGEDFNDIDNEEV